MLVTSEDPVDADDRGFLVFSIRQLHGIICFSGLVEIEIEFSVGNNDPDRAARLLTSDKILSGFRCIVQK